MRPPPLIDLHQDISLYYVMGGFYLKFKPADFADEVKESHGGIPKFRRANVKLVFSSIAPLFPTLDKYRTEALSKGYGYAIAMRTGSPTMTALEHIQTYHNLFKKHPEALAHVTRAGDIQRVMEGDKTGFLTAMEGSEPLEDVEDLELFYRLGLRSLQLTWSFDTKYAATCMSKKDYGLTGDGEELVRLSNRLGVIVDLAHASKNTVLETCSLSRLPVIVSHANSMSVFRHPRNVDDEEIEAVKRTRGVIGMTFIGPAISKRADLKGLAKHIKYVYETFGPEILSIGTDFFGLVNVDEPKGLEDVTKLKDLWSELLDRGLKASDIEKISYGNALRVVQENSRHWRSL